MQREHTFRASTESGSARDERGLPLKWQALERRFAMEGADKDVINRDATFSDIEPLTNLRPPRGLHADRIRDRFSSDARYVVAEVNGKPAAFGVIHFQGDPMWERPEQVPIVMDLYVAPALRK